MWPAGPGAVAQEMPSANAASSPPPEATKSLPADEAKKNEVKKNAGEQDEGKKKEGEEESSLPPKLLALVALATAIERFWEAIFGYIERLGKAGIRLIAGGAELVKWVEKTQEGATAALEALVASAPGAQSSAALALYQEAEKRLLDAQSRIEESLRSPRYLAIKTATTTLGSLVLGVVLNCSLNLRLLEAVGFSGIDKWIDYVATGLAIGAGPGPLHSLIRSLEEFRRAVGGIADLVRGAGVKKAFDALREPATGNAVTLVAPLPSSLGVAPQAGGLVAVSEGDLRLQRAARRLLR